MKISKTQLKQIIKEELSKALSEGDYDIDTGVPAMSPEEIERERMEDEIEKNYADPVERERAKQELGDAGKLPARKN
jgi:hypothetical protein